MGALLSSLLIDVPTASGRVWRCAPIDRAIAFRTGLLQSALGIAREEAAQAAQLLHLDDATREAIQAQADAAQAAAGGAAIAERLGQRDEIACACVRGVRIGEQEVSVRLVLDVVDADEAATPERVWVGSLPPVEVLTLGEALLASWVAEVHAGARFRSEQGPPAREG